MIHSIKPGIQVVGIDDRVHQRGDEKTKLAFIFCAGIKLERFLQAEIDVDGLNATSRVIDTLEPHKEYYRIILTHGITCGGLNMFDITKIHDALGVPVIAVTENEPKEGALEEAIVHLPDIRARKEILAKSGNLESVQTDAGKNKVYFHVIGMPVTLAKQYLKKFAVRSRLPECLLLAHIIATGL